jgi:hypothetical protein
VHTPLRRFWNTLRVAFALAATTSMSAADALPGVGTEFDRLEVGKRVFHRVKVRSVTVRSITFTHSDGLASVQLKELPADLQAVFGYSAEAETAADARIAEKRRTAAPGAKPAHSQALQREASLANRFDKLVQELSLPPVLLPQVDLRPKFRELSLGVKDQGRRPSCAVFAVVSALEFQNAQLTGRAEKLSEEYLIWATRKSTRRVALIQPLASPDEENSDDRDGADEGFSLAEVVASLRAYGVPLQSSMPNTFGKHMDAIPDPSEDLVGEARSRRKVFVHSLSSRNRESQLGAIIHALNAEVPVVIGTRWPNARAAFNGFLSEQKPVADYAHAVTLVGYKCETGRIEDAVFLFRNSYGIEWGQAGYGWMTFGYLKSYLLDAILLEVQRGEV